MLLSIIIPTRNRAAYLRASIESALAQTIDGPREIVIVDDGSTDETPDVIAEFARRDACVRGLRVACGAPSRTRNAGIRASTGEFVAFLDDDDRYLRPFHTEALARFATEGPELGMVYGQAQPVDADLKPIFGFFPPLPLPEGQPVGAFLRDTVHLNTVVVRRTALDAVGLFDEALAGAEDKDLTVRVARRFRVAALTEGGPVALVRFHRTDRLGKGPSLFGRWSDERAVLLRHFAVQDAHQPDGAQRAGTFRRLRGWYANLLITQAQTDLSGGDRRGAREALRFAFSISPLHAAKDTRFWTLMGRTVR